ncbi:mule transposase protein [Fusarium langsethiae]|uniref:Mule transposase protein n=1 Tax=Fusarium langsethiae TaxID=179993 RepID=A0A0M9ETE5_FUSLA|nr:mule transposase protein [Fusarium langsethiae]
MQDMMRDQERDFTHASAEDEVLTSHNYIGSSSEYLGELRTVISAKALGLITKQYRLARKAMPTGKNPNPSPLGACDDNCSVSIELGIPCYHAVFQKLGSATSFTKWEVHQRWRLRESTSRDPYRHILDPKIVTSLRGRPKNTTQAVPARLAIEASRQPGAPTSSQPDRTLGPRRGRPPGSRNKSTLTRLTQEASQQASSQASSKASGAATPSSQVVTRSQSANLGVGRTTGLRASGRRTQPSVRRQRSQWELIGSDEDTIRVIVD